MTHADILAKLDVPIRHLGRTALELKLRKTRVVAMNAAAGNHPADKKRRTVRGAV